MLLPRLSMRLRHPRSRGAAAAPLAFACALVGAACLCALALPSGGGGGDGWVLPVAAQGRPTSLPRVVPSSAPVAPPGFGKAGGTPLANDGLAPFTARTFGFLQDAQMFGATFQLQYPEKSAPLQPNGRRDFSVAQLQQRSGAVKTTGGGGGGSGSGKLPTRPGLGKLAALVSSLTSPTSLANLTAPTLTGTNLTGTNPLGPTLPADLPVPLTPSVPLPVPVAPVVPPLAPANCYALASMESYTAVDWGRWDSYLTPQYLFAVPSLNYPAASPADAQYRDNFAHRVVQRPFATLFAYFDYISTVSPKPSFLRELTSDNYFSASNVILNVSSAINVAYNAHRCHVLQQLAAVVRAEAAGAALDALAVEVEVLKRFDALGVDFASLPGVAGVVSWLQDYITALFATQSQTHGFPGTDFDVFGFFANHVSYGSGYDRRSHFFRAAGIGRLTAHYAHLFSSPFLRTLRHHVRLMVSALLVQEQARQPGQHSTAQWLLDIEAWSLAAYTLRQSERILRLRGAWLDSDESAQTNPSNGEWRTSDVVAHTEGKLDWFATRLRKFGVTEFMSEYYSISFIALGSILQHPASQKLYDLADECSNRLWTDLSLHFTPFTGTFSAPSGRSYALYDGAHSILDALEIPIVVQPAFRPACENKWDREVQGTLASATSVLQQLSVTCPLSTPTTLPASANPRMDVARLILFAAQLAGITPMVRPMFQANNIDLPRRVVQQRHSALHGQERYNFVDATQGFEMGHAGEDWYGLAMNNVVVARLGGAPTPGAPVFQSRLGPSLSLGYVRLFAENNDQPFGTSRGSPGENFQTPSRYVIAQYQHLMLITSLLNGHRNIDPAALTAWNTNLVAPLAASALLADDQVMPITEGSAMAIPPASILTVKHLDLCFGARLVSADRSAASNIPDATSFTALPAQTPGAGVQPYSLIWQVDSTSLPVGAGRWTVHHRHAGSDSTVRAYRVVWLWAVKRCASDDERRSFQAMLRAAPVTQSFVDENWNVLNQPWMEPPQPYYAEPWFAPQGHSDWTVNAQIDGHTLSVRRKDVYNPWNNNPKFVTPVDSPLHHSPTWIDTLERRINGAEQLRFQDGVDANSWAAAGPETGSSAVLPAV